MDEGMRGCVGCSGGRFLLLWSGLGGRGKGGLMFDFIWFCVLRSGLGGEEEFAHCFSGFEILRLSGC